jgi:universal stress protein E
MSAYQKILVVINPHSDNQDALYRGVFLAEKFNCQLVLASAVYDSSYDMPKLLNSNQRELLKQRVLDAQHERLQEYASPFSQLSNVLYKVVWHKHFHKGIVKLAKTENVDLIIKAAKNHDKLSQRLFTPSDWHILRHSHANVLMVKHHEMPEGGNIVCAISLEDKDEQHECLSDEVSLAANAFAKVMAGQLCISNSFIGAPVHISIEVPQFDPQTYNSNVELRRKNLINKLCDKHALNNTQHYVMEGLPEDTIPQLCSQLNAELLVLGSVGRKGIKAALLGNTAEHIIDKIGCDTLVVKPKTP